MRHQYLLLLVTLRLGAGLSNAHAQQAPAAAAPAKPMYGSARIWLANTDYCHLGLADGVTPTRTFDYLEENGKRRRFTDEAAALNFLYQLGWDVQPLGVTSDGIIHYFLLKRRLL
ncbi:hypothetical protein J0X19_10945 [Hymenobacter sp. BT186]|uniref:Uncharacterized protein n=1 Tax=Hymenobacter telluris TaxID=2816474 RepID=A0A939EYY3_9BACT|nr:hypothetical protein [Hymenobacter telluris]MBO0358463.1 hypothetical protein [Hymenobacter telluris]MBW3374489.1 hypothetical protein [Hymenobacter norwichensis]